jgi:hypothetical protein
MTPIERLRATVEALSLTAVDARLENLLEEASKAEPSYAEFLAGVLQAYPSRKPILSAPCPRHRLET